MSEHEHRTPVVFSTAHENDPHMQPAANNPDGVERRIAVLFVVAFLLIVAFGYCYWVNDPYWTLGATMGGALFLLGVGLVAWGKYLMPKGPFVEERHDFASSDEEREAFAATIVERGGGVVKRRPVLGGLLGAGLGAFSIAALFPLLGSLGPRPKDTLDKTDWKSGDYLVDITGRRYHVDDMAIGSILTVFPEGKNDDPQAQNQDQVVLIRISDSDFTTQKGREKWGPSGYVAYSKLCTHLGCPVGLYEKKLQMLVCPCHQSMFDVRNGAIPNFGPAPRPLPQLPLKLDANGYLLARAGFNEPVGPGYWERK